MLKSAGNPMMLMQNALSSNPQLKSALDMANGDYQKAFYKLAEMKGIDPNEILSAMK